jgi:hypothetical protein
MAKPNEQLSDAEAQKRMNDALRRALSTPPIRKPEPKRKAGSDQNKPVSRDAGSPKHD